MMVKQSTSEKQPVGEQRTDDLVVRLLRQALGTTVELTHPAVHTSVGAVARLPDGTATTLQFIYEPALRRILWELRPYLDDVVIIGG